MDNIYQMGIEIILFLQSLGDWLFLVMRFFTFLGDEEFYLLVTPIVYWCLDTRIGIRTAIMLMVSNTVYNVGKWLFHTSRPYWVSNQVRLFRAESSFGMPSGHATSAVTIWGYLAASFGKSWFWGVAIALMVLIGLSRVVLAVHFPHDVLLGWIFGLLTLIIFIRIEPIVERWLKDKSTQSKIWLSLLASVVMILVALAALLPLRSWSIPHSWVENAALSFPDEPTINPTSLSGQITVAGTFFGLATGHVLLFARKGYTTRGRWWQQLLRYLVGVAGVFMIWAGLDAIFPEGDTLIPYIFRYIRYGMVGFWITFLAPNLFIRLKIAYPSIESP